MAKNKTLILGASTNPNRYSFRALKSLRQHGHIVYAIGAREGSVEDVAITTNKTEFDDVDTVTLYLSAKNQEQYIDYIIGLKPNRIIYNPGAENSNLEKRAEEEGIENLEACTLVLLATGQY
jgi:predicted CoA-binding protein